MGSFGRVAWAAIVVAAWASPAYPQRVEPVFFGGAGDQQGQGIAYSGGALYVTGQAGSQGVALKYALPLSATPAWGVLAPGPSYFYGIGVSEPEVFAVGAALPPACGASDGSGGTEPKVGLARLTTAGALTACESANFFTYRGGETWYGIAPALEGSERFFYAGGGAENCGFGHSPFVLAKYALNGAMVNRVTEPGVGFNGFNCVGGSHVFAVRVWGGFIYTSGYSQLTGQGEDGVPRPTIMKYDAALARVWKKRDMTSGPGALQTFAVREGQIFAGGYSYTVGLPSDYLLQRYDGEGNLLWSRTWGGPGSAEVITGLAATPRALWAVGYTYAGGLGGADVSIQEIDPLTGRIRHSLVWGGARDDFARGVITVGHEVYVVGESRSFAVGGNVVGQNDLVLLRYRRE